MHQKRSISRRVLVAVIAALSTAAMFIVPATARAATPAQSIAAVQTSVSAAAPSLATASTTKSCSTGGYSYQTDSMYVVRSWTGSSWKYVVTRSPNRTVYDSNYHSYTHSGKTLFVYWSMSSSSGYSFPASSTFYSRSSGVDFRGIFLVVVDGGVHSFTTICDVYF